MQQDDDTRVTTEEAEGMEEEEEEAINPMAAVQEDVDAEGAGSDAPAGGEDAAGDEPRGEVPEKEPSASLNLRGAREGAESEVAVDV